MRSRVFSDLVKRHGGFSTQEKREFWLSTIILAIAFSWGMWGTVTFEFWVGIGNFILSFIFAATTLFVHHKAQKLYGLFKGLKVTHHLVWFWGGISLFISILSNGLVTFLALTGTKVKVLPKHRLGEDKQLLMNKEWSMISIIGPAANVIFAGILFGINVPVQFTTLHNFAMFNLIFALLNLIPLPPFDGSRIIYASRLVYTFVVASIAGYLFLASKLAVYNWLWAILFGLVILSIFYLFYEQPWK
jgi:Zn-dependent protease